MPNVLRVLTFNAASLFEPGWDERRHEILAWFARVDPDVVCLQEITESDDRANTAGWLVDHCAEGRWHWEFGGFPWPEVVADPSVRFGSAILSRWPLEAFNLVLLPVDEGDVPAGFTMRSELVHARTAGIDVFSTHLVAPPHQAYHRVRQVVAIDENIQALANPAAPMPPVLCGDFNADPASDEIRYFSAQTAINGRTTYFQEAWTAAANTDPGFTWDRRTNPMVAAMYLPPRRLDYVFVGDPFGRPGGAGLVLSAELALHEPLTGTIASDHYGVLADIHWPLRPIR